MTTEPQQTSVENVTYDLVSVLFHALEGSQAYASYIKDAESSGNRQLADFFRQVQQEDNNRAQRARQLLKQLS
jgi:rubrerythrin